MSDSRLTIRLSASVRKALRQRAKAIGKPESEVARAAIEKDVVKESRPRTLYEALMESGFIGCASGGPGDLSTNKKYMQGFGEWESDSNRRRPAGRVGRPARRTPSAVR